MTDMSESQNRTEKAWRINPTFGCPSLEMGLYRHGHGYRATHHTTWNERYMGNHRPTDQINHIYPYEKDMDNGAIGEGIPR